MRAPPGHAPHPPQFPSPFDELGPHPLAREAAGALMAELAGGLIGPGIPTALLAEAEGGKMFGVLVAENQDGRRHVLRAFSGLLAGKWLLPGFVPPAFDPEEREEVERGGAQTVAALHHRCEDFARGEPLLEARRALAELVSRHAGERGALRALHLARRQVRSATRAALMDTGAGRSAPSEAAAHDEAREAALHALDQESRGDKAEQRSLTARHRAELEPVERTARRLERRLQALQRLRQAVSRAVMKQLHDTYVLTGAGGSQRPLRALYAGEPPSGAGDCAAPKLLVHARRLGLRPLALAEFWWGAPPATGGRVQGAYYPACKDKCGPLLPFLLQHLDVAPPRRFSPAPPPALTLPIVHADRWLLAVDKPHGLLSIPGRGEDAQDSVLARLRTRHPEAEGPLLVHRLDLDTSGLLLAALDPRTHTALQHRFLRREIEKRYIAVLEGIPRGERGTISLPLRGDPHDRPRQIHDPLHGKVAITDWELLAVEGQRARVALFPRTGRTHQLRVHAAHPRGLGVAMVGDRLYGREDARLLLHAESLTFTHPATGTRMELLRPAPF